jgi:hypothetical protein
MGLISRQTAQDLWLAYDEIAKGEKLVADMEQALKDGSAPTPRDPFGRVRQLQLGVPQSDTSTRLFDVAPRLAISVIKAHVAEKRAVLEATNERARGELGS